MARCSRIFKGEAFNDHHEEGVYVCAKCASPLFDSSCKFNYQGDYWPSFRSFLQNQIKRQIDIGNIYEVMCANCNLHLGHEFDDGSRLDPDEQQRTGLRY